MSTQLNAIHSSVSRAGNDDDGVIISPLTADVDSQIHIDDSLVATSGGLFNRTNGLTDNHLAVGSPTVPLARSRGSPETTQKLSNATIALTMMSLCLSVTLSALDLTIVTTAVPAIAGSFKSVAGYVWVGGAYILAYAAITPVWGSVADIWGRKPIMLIALAIFLGGSLLCALAPDMDAMIAGRAIQGLGASGMSILVNVVISDMFSLRDRGLYLAITSIVWAVGSAVGPVLGGVFTTRLR